MLTYEECLARSVFLVCWTRTIENVKYVEKKKTKTKKKKKKNDFVLNKKKPLQFLNVLIFKKTRYSVGAF